MSYDTFTPFFPYIRTVLFTLYDVKVFEIYDFVCGCMELYGTGVFTSNSMIFIIIIHVNLVEQNIVYQT